MLLKSDYSQLLTFVTALVGMIDVMAEGIPKTLTNIESRKEYLILQTHNLRKWALIVAAVFTVVTILMDCLRFPIELSKITISLRFVFSFIPLTILAYKYIIKQNDDLRAHVGWLFFITIAAALIHSYVYYTANMQGIYFPKAGIAIILIYAGLLFAMPVVLAALASTIIIVQAGITYFVKNEAVSDIMVLIVFYGMISVCCILINIICIRILSKNYKLINIIKNQAFTDELTGLYNRRFFYLEAIKRAKQANRDSLDYAIITIDLDHFKPLNDNFGHKFGDEALVIIGEILSSHCQRPFDFATRMGGDEFVLFLYGTDKSHAEKTCQRIITELKNQQMKVTNNNPPEYLSASIGAVIVDTKNQNLMHMNDVVEKADDLLYAVKRESRNGFKLKVLAA